MKRIKLNKLSNSNNNLLVNKLSSILNNTFYNSITAINAKFSTTTTTNKTTKLLFPERTLDLFLYPDKYQYVDKTCIIPRILDNNQTEIILRPDGFGKSTNLNIIRYFLSNNKLLDDSVDITSREAFFKYKKVNNINGDSSKYFNKYPVIMLNLKELDGKDYEENIDKIRNLLYTEYEQILQYDDLSLTTSSKLSIIEKKKILEFFDNYSHIPGENIPNAFKDLTKYLLKVTSKNPFVLIDDFDFPLINASNHDIYFYNKTKELLQQIFLKLSLKNNNYINKLLMTGTFKTEIKSLFEHTHNLNVHSLEYDSKYQYCFGFSKEELKSLVVNSSNEELTHLKKYFINTDEHRIVNYEVFSNSIQSSNNFQTSVMNRFISMINEDSNIEGIKLYNSLLKKINHKTSEECNLFQDITLYGSPENNFNLMQIKPRSTYFVTLFLNLGLLTFKEKAKNIETFEITCEASSHTLSKFLPSLETLTNLFSRVYFGHYQYLWNNKEDVDGFLEYLKYLVELKPKKPSVTSPSGVTTSGAAGITAATPTAVDSDLLFKTDIELHNFISEALTIDADLPNSNILLYNNTECSWLGNWNAVIYNNRNFSVVFNTKKYKKPFPKKKTTESTESSVSKVKKGKGKSKGKVDKIVDAELIKEEVSLPEELEENIKSEKEENQNTIEEEMDKINENMMKDIDKKEVAKFILKKHPKNEKVYFVTASNYQRQFEYLVDIVNVKQI